MNAPAQPVRASDFVATFLHEFQYIAGALDEISAALTITTDIATRGYFEERRTLWLREAATLYAAFKAFSAEWLQADADALLARHLVNEIRWFGEAKKAEPYPDKIAACSASLANEYQRVAARFN
jgi:hypothetical protein